MHIVDQAHMPPGCCIVTQSSEGPFIDTGLTPALVDPRVYVSRQAVIDMGRLFGFPTPAEADSLHTDNYQLHARLDQVERELAEANRYAEAAEYTLKATFGDDAKVKNKPGRKPRVNA